MAAHTDIAPVPVEVPAPTGAADAEVLDALLRDWLLGYRSVDTRLAYGDALGLNRPWVRALDGTAPSTPGTRRPPARLGRYRDLAWFRWCDRNGLHPLAATGTDIKRWHAALDLAGMPKSTRGHRLAAVSEFYRHLVERGALGANPAAFNRKGLGLGTAGDTSSTVVLTAEQVDALFAASLRPRRGVSPLMGLRARAVVALFTLGLRVSELADLRRADLHSTRGRRALHVTGKGDKLRIVYLSGIAWDALNAYLAERDRQSRAAVLALPGHVVSGNSPLIATTAGGHLNPRDIWALLRRLARAAGPEMADVADRMTPHALRHFYVTTAAEGGADMTHVQADVGHASVDTTNRVYNQAARHPDRSAVDIVEQALAQARARRVPHRRPGDTPVLRTPADLLTVTEPLDQLACIQRLEHLTDDDSALRAPAREALGALAADPGTHPTVATAARAARLRIPS